MESPKRQITDYYEVLDFFGGAPPDNYSDAKKEAEARGVEISEHDYETAMQIIEQP